MKATTTKSKIWDICFPQSRIKEQLRPWITISKHHVESKLHLMPRTLFIDPMNKKRKSNDFLLFIFS
ncbi:hypothetical protein DMR38_06465 [Clostridium sp. AWRP]|nr:hypothetical protein DMR38_06465 [Clostridium sp. AWRP]